VAAPSDSSPESPVPAREASANDATGGKPPSKPPGWFKRQWRRLFAWLRNRSPSTLDGLVSGLLSGVVLLAVSGALGYLIGRSQGLNLTDQVAFWVAALASFTTLIAGGGFGWLVARLISRGKLRNVDLQKQLEFERRETAERERDVARLELEALEPNAEAYVLLSSYIEHCHEVLGDMAVGRITLTAFPDDLPERLTRSVCETPRTLMQRHGKIDVRISLWVEQRRMARRKAFRVLYATENHRHGEAKQFEVAIAKSWMHHAHEQTVASRKQIVHGIDDLDIAGLFGDDLDVFKRFGYQAIRVVGFDVSGDVGRLVFLAPEKQAFSLLEDRYLQLLHGTLNLAGQLSRKNGH
jgi:hypothetical protein